MPTLLALSGSLRADSSNQTILRVLAASAPAHVQVRFYEELAHLPVFSPSADEPAAAVADLQRQLIEADGVVICTPEYA